MTNRKGSIGAAALAAALVLTATAATAQQSWRMATSWAGGPLLQNAAGRTARNIELLTNGGIKLETLPADTVGGALQVSEAVRNRVVEAGHSWAGYDWNVERAAVLVGGFAGGLDGEQMFQWLYEGGGLELYREFRSEVFDVVALPCGILPREMGMHSRREVQTLADFKSLKLRTSGAWAEIAAELGAAVVDVPGGEVYAALERGDIDAVEWAQLSFNTSLGFHKVARYLVVPGLHQPSMVLECSFNRQAWDGLSERARQMIEIAGKLSSFELYQQTRQADAEAFRAYLRSENEVVVLDAEAQSKARELSLAWAERIAGNRGGWFKRIWEHQKAFRQVWEDAYGDRHTAPPLN